MRKVLFFAAALLAAAIILPGCDTQVEYRDVEKIVEIDTWDWMTDPPVITDADIDPAKTINTKVVVIGTGISGNAAYRAAAEKLGGTGNVVVVERNASTFHRGLVYGALNSSYQKHIQPTAGVRGGHLTDDALMEVAKYTHNYTGNRSNLGLWVKWAFHSGKAFDFWIKDMEDWTTKIPGYPYGTNKLTGPTASFPDGSPWVPDYDYPTIGGQKGADAPAYRLVTALYYNPTTQEKRYPDPMPGATVDPPAGFVRVALTANRNPDRPKFSDEDGVPAITPQGEGYTGKQFFDKNRPLASHRLVTRIFFNETTNDILDSAPLPYVYDDVSKKWIPPTGYKVVDLTVAPYPAPIPTTKPSLTPGDIREIKNPGGIVTGYEADSQYYSTDALRQTLADQGTNLNGFYLMYFPLMDNNPNFNHYATGINFQTGVGGMSGNWYMSKDFQTYAAEKAGAKFLWKHDAKLLIRDEVETSPTYGKVIGVYVLDMENDEIIRINAEKGVILATGDYASNYAMVRALCPELLTITAGNAPNGYGDGYGHKMGIWAGGKMEPTPHSHVSHTMGATPGGVISTLKLNLYGKRFMNEDVDGQLMTNQVIRQPGRAYFNIWDARIHDEYMSSLNDGHGAPDSSNLYNPIDATTGGYLSIDEMLEALFPAALANEAQMTEANRNITYFPNAADRAERIKNAKDAIDKYNAAYLTLVGNELEKEFGVPREKMWPITDPPFFMVRNQSTGGYNTTSGIMVDSDHRVLPADGKTPFIHGLWAVGNASGGKYTGDYPILIPASSHGTAATHGMFAGWNAAVYPLDPPAWDDVDWK